MILPPELELTLKGESELDDAARSLLDFAGDCKVILFNGAMGAGKTTFIKAICRQLGSKDNLSSPTYAIVNEYNYDTGKIYHFDLYRLKAVSELFDLGIEEYLYSGHFCFFEWPQLVESLLDGSYVTVKISVDRNIRYLRAAK